MLLNELFGSDKQPLLESATVQHVVDLIRDFVPDCRAIWLYRENSRGPWNFIAVANDMIDHRELATAKEKVRRIEQGMKGVDLRIAVQIESAFHQPEGATKVYARPPAQ
jgi:hypothetical protein